MQSEDKVDNYSAAKLVGGMYDPSGGSWALGRRGSRSWGEAARRQLPIDSLPASFGLGLGKRGISVFLHIDDCKTSGISSLEFELYL